MIRDGLKCSLLLHAIHQFAHLEFFFYLLENLFQRVMTLPKLLKPLTLDSLIINARNILPLKRNRMQIIEATNSPCRYVRCV